MLVGVVELHLLHTHTDEVDPEQGEHQGPQHPLDGDTRTRQHHVSTHNKQYTILVK